MKEYEFDDFMKFKVVCYKLFNDSDFLVNIPKSAKSYKIKMFETKKDIINYVETLTNKGKMYILLSGSLRGFSSREDISVLEIGEMYGDFDEVIIGGCYQ